MKYYRLKQPYPGSPQIGYVMSAISSEMILYRPDVYTNLWECFEPEETLKTQDGENMVIGQKVFYIEDFSVKFTYLNQINLLTQKYYFKEENAKSALIQQIVFPTEDGIVKGQDCKIYSLLTKSDWQISASTSLILCRKQMRKTAESNSFWKYFLTEESRDKYKFLHKPVFSRYDIIAKFGDIISEEVALYKLDL